MRYVVKRIMWCRCVKTSNLLGFSRPQHHIIFYHQSRLRKPIRPF